MSSEQRKKTYNHYENSFGMQLPYFLFEIHKMGLNKDKTGKPLQMKIDAYNFSKQKPLSASNCMEFFIAKDDE